MRSLTLIVAAQAAVLAVKPGRIEIGDRALGCGADTPANMQWQGRVS